MGSPVGKLVQNGAHGCKFGLWKTFGTPRPERNLAQKNSYFPRSLN